MWRNLGVEKEKIALLPCSLTQLAVGLRARSIDWEIFRSLCCLQDLNIYNEDNMTGFGIQLDDSFATALPLLRVFGVSPGVYNRQNVALETTAKVVMPHLVELRVSYVNMVHLDLHFMSTLKSLSLSDCIVSAPRSAVSAACSTMVLHNCQMRKGTVLVTPNLRSLIIYGGGLHKLDGSKCRHALSILFKESSIEWVGPSPMYQTLRRLKNQKAFLTWYTGFLFISIEIRIRMVALHVIGFDQHIKRCKYDVLSVEALLFFLRKLWTCPALSRCA